MPDQRIALKQGLALAVVVLLLDQLSKLWVLDSLLTGESLSLTGFFNLVLVYNPGAAFSFLAGAGGWQKWFFLVLAIGVSAWVINSLRQPETSLLLSLGLSLIMGGALGNAIDRLAYGAVVDFLDFHWQGLHWPAFNLADAAICLGAFLLVWDQFAQKPVQASTSN